MIDRYHGEAVDAETRIVHGCGFDSVPADIGRTLVQSFAAREFGTPCEIVRIYFDDGDVGVRGSTLASAAEV